MSNEDFKIEGVEIFASGVHNGDCYTTEDLDDMVSNFREVGFTPPLKAGHDDTPGKPAIGWIENVRRHGSKLIADITHIPSEIYNLIKRRGYDRVSSEIFWNAKQNGKTFRRVLKAVALLGADIPAVGSLKPLHQHFSASPRANVRVYDITGGFMNDAHQHDSPYNHDAAQRLDRAVRQHMTAHNSTDYVQSMQLVLASDPGLKRDYLNFTSHEITEE